MSDSNQNDDIAFDLPKNQSSVIKVIGVGGGGSNAVNHMYGSGIKGVDFVVCNTDSQALSNSPVPNKIQLGVTLTEGLGAGANPEVGQQAAEESLTDIEKLLETNTKMVFITAGMGGGTGTGAAPVIAKSAKDAGILTVGIVTIPFAFEGNNRKMQAEKGVEELRNAVDSLVVINNNKLREVYGNLGFKAGFAKADEVLATAARGIAEVITHHYTTNIDLRDAKTVLANSGTAIMGSASASGENRAATAIGKALDSPLLNDNHIKGAQNVLLLIVSGNEEITIDEIGEINDHIQREAGGGANIIMGIGDDDKLGDDVSVTIVATGFTADQQMQVTGGEPQKVVHTLEDEQPVSKSVFSKPLPKNEEDESDDLIAKELAKLNEKRAEKPQRELFNLEDDESSQSAGGSQHPENDAQSTVGNQRWPTKKPVDLDENFVHESSSEKEIDLEKKEVKIDSKKQEEIGEKSAPIFEINSDIKKEKKEEEKEAIRFSLTDEDSDDEKEIPKKKEITVSKKDNETVRFSLDEYEELKNQLNSAKPPSIKKQESTTLVDEQDSDESLQFELKKVDKPRAKTNEHSSRTNPTDLPLEQNPMLKADERRAKLTAFNHRFKNHQNAAIDDAEKVPAYKRQGVKIEDKKYSREDNSSRFTIDDGEDGADIKTNNSFLHDNVD